MLAIALIILVLLAGLLWLAQRQPARFRIERRITIEAPAARVFERLQDFHAWAAWSPWEHLDPDLKRHFSGASSGLGAVYQWDGKGQVGSGRMEIVQIEPLSRLLIQLDFSRPFKAHNQAEFTLQAASDNATTVNWSMSGPQLFIGKLMGLFVNMDKMIGKDFEAGLAKLKSLCEQPV